MVQFSHQLCIPSAQAHLLFLCSSAVNATLALVDMRFQDRSKFASEVEPRI
jgi:hypothetical protein